MWKLSIKKLHYYIMILLFIHAHIEKFLYGTYFQRNIALAALCDTKGMFHLTFVMLLRLFHFCCSSKVKQRQMILANIANICKWNAL